MTGIDLGTGLLDGNASNARLWTELILTNSSVDWSLPDAPMSLEPAFPSPAEALAVMAACTLIVSSIDAPFVEFWNFSTTILDEPQAQFFNASVRAQQVGKLRSRKVTVDLRAHLHLTGRLFQTDANPFTHRF